MHIAGRRFMVTGGASLIGSHLTQQLLEAEAAAVILFDNYALGSPEVAASLAQDRRVTAVRGDITRLPELLDALNEVDGVFALAGFLTLPLSQNPGLGLEVNVQGMYNIVEACRYRGVKKVVFASSVATYGNPEVDEVDETTPFYWQTAPPALALYAASKIIGENLLRLYQQRYGLDYVALRYATVYGERQHHRGVNALHIIASYERIKPGGARRRDGVVAGELQVVRPPGAERGCWYHQSDPSRERGLACCAIDAGGSWASAPWLPRRPGSAPVPSTGQPIGDVAAVGAAAKPCHWAPAHGPLCAGLRGAATDCRQGSLRPAQPPATRHRR